MVSFLRTLRGDERRDTLIAFALLGLLVASHSILEAARDALFLVGLPASRLPIVYLAIGAASLLISELQSYLKGGASRRRTLQGWTAVAGAVTVGFWLTLPALGNIGLYALYVWSGVVTTLILVHFWTLLSGAFSVTEAKRAYGVIGVGSVTGGIAGSAVASALVSSIGPRHLLLIAGLGWAAAAVGASFLQDSGTTQQAKVREGIGASLRVALGQPFVLRLMGLVFVSATAVTFADYLFKGTAAEQFSPEQLAPFFAKTYLALNIASLGVQLLLVGPVISRLGVLGAFALLPLALLGSSVGMLLAGGWVAALVVKGSDGALRHTMHRTSLELLFVPLPERMRERAKTIADVVAQRGGQALASVAILTLAAVGGPIELVAAAVVVLAMLWLFGVLDVRRHYLDLFRRQLSASQVPHLDEFPDLDMGSLEALIAALDSKDDRRVTAAIDVLELEGRAHLVPSLAVYHPAPEVCRHVLTFLVRNRRVGAVHAIDRILDHPSPEIRGAAIVARTVLDPDAELLSRRREEESSDDVLAMIAVAEAVTSGDGDDVREIIRNGSVSNRVALAGAIAASKAPALFHGLAELTLAREADVRISAARAIGEVQAPTLLPALIPLLEAERTRGAAIDALRRNGTDGFDVLAGALDEISLPINVRWRLPRLMVDCSPERAGPALLERLAAEADGLVRYGIILALEIRSRRAPDLPLDPAGIDGAIHRTLERAFGFVDSRVQLRAGVREQPERATEGHRLLDDLLKDKTRNATDRLLRLLALKHPFEDFKTIRAGLASEDRKLRATGSELLESILTAPVRDEIVALVDGRALDAQRSAGRRHLQSGEGSYDALLSRLVTSSSDAIRATAEHHVRELGLSVADAESAATEMAHAH